MSYTERLGEVRFFLSAELPIFLYIKDISLLEAKIHEGTISRGRKIASRLLIKELHSKKGEDLAQQLNIKIKESHKDCTYPLWLSKKRCFFLSKLSKEGRGWTTFKTGTLLDLGGGHSIGISGKLLT